MNPRIKICIPSKGRPDTTVYKIFEKLGYEVYLFLEPQDFDKYNVTCKKINIGKDNQGIAFVRNYIVKFAKKNNFEWICMCDDDVRFFGKAILHTTGKYKGKYNRGRKDDYVKEALDKTLDMHNTIFALNYRKSTIQVKKPHLNINSTSAEVVIWFRPQEIKAYYDKNVNLKEDRDFIIQNRKNGLNVVRLNRYFFSTPNIGTNDGGLKDEYKLRKDEESAIKMLKKWGSDIIQLKKNNSGRLDIRINWKNI